MLLVNKTGGRLHFGDFDGGARQALVGFWDMVVVSQGMAGAEHMPQDRHQHAKLQGQQEQTRPDDHGRVQQVCMM